ncbi:MAPEG family protein [Egbenema bharatensis]|uniref:MAPEG family protein n=1 Tax=Egbenema bharatensis TaxID=3463334 RepID=UPI003A88DE54
MPFLQQLSTPTVLLWSLALAMVLVYAPFLVVAYSRFKVGYDMAAPRTMLDKLPAFAQRATWAHQNSFEAFSLFAVAALMAYVTQVQSPLAAVAAIVHIFARSLYSVFYILNLPLLRSLMFGLGGLGTATLVGLSLLQINF